MWNYEKRLQYPINIKTPNAKLAQFIMSQYGGPDGEISASLRYLSQRFSMPNRMAAAVLNDIGTEELAHLEMVSTIVHQLTRDLSMEEIEKSGLGAYYIDHTVGIWPQAAGGIPFNACEFQSKGDPLTDLFEDLAKSKKPVPPMTIFSVWYATSLRLQIPSDFSVQEKWFIFRDSVKQRVLIQAKIKDLFLEISVVLFSIRFSFCFIRYSM